MGRKEDSGRTPFLFQASSSKSPFAPLSPPFSSRSFTVIAVVRGKEEGWRRRPLLFSMDNSAE